MKFISASKARAILPRLADEVDRSREPVTIERRGRPLVRLVPIELSDLLESEMPLRSVPIRIAEDFDEPLADQWEALDP